MSGYGDMLAHAAGEVDVDLFLDGDDEPASVDPALAPLASLMEECRWRFVRDGLGARHPQVTAAASSLFTAACAGDVVARLLPVMGDPALLPDTDVMVDALWREASRLDRSGAAS